ncbi:hypothetical protein [Halobaculum gomorrense]|uniref:Uncharacterized protein n=1 Tax=Halobaculum gomorrense TaxID=43928 RepID=A0A1M5KNH4_9EURY|nr:hypothetical protein [Halobaculum gomorrense]SHG53743.1 hypothetical protein SAMN05443636_0562 [Halobaculum gomorrense]
MHGQSTSADQIREALRALAVAPPRRDGDSDGPRSTSRVTPAQRDLVAEAEEALTTVEGAAAFAADGGFRRTRTVAEAAADLTLARRARAVVETIERYRAAYRASTGRTGRSEASIRTGRDDP